MAQHKLLSTYIDADDSITRKIGIDETTYKKLAVLAELKKHTQNNLRNRALANSCHRSW
jgi:hypothetical protein